MNKKQLNHLDIISKLGNSTSRKFRLHMYLITLLTSMISVTILTVIDVSIVGILFTNSTFIDFLEALFSGILSYFVPVALSTFILIMVLIKPIYKAMKKKENNEEITPEELNKARMQISKIPVIIILVNTLFPILLSIVISIVTKKPEGIEELTIIRDLSINILASAVQISLYQKVLAAPASILEIHKIDKSHKDIFAKHMNKIQIYASVIFVVSTTMFGQFSLKDYILEQMGSNKLEQTSNTTPSNIAFVEDKSAKLMLLLFLLTMPIVIVSNIIIDRSKNTQTKILKMILKEMAHGEADLTRRVVIVQADNNGELSELINGVLERMQNMFRNVITSATKVADSSNEIGNVLYKTVSATEEMIASVKQINGNSEQFRAVVMDSQSSLEKTLESLNKITENVSTQAAFVDQTSSAMEEMVANINSVNGVTAKANSLAEALTGISKKGGDAVSSSITAVREIEVSSAEVSNLVMTISKILAQTNILAMNAAIEAAHAGEAGRGFAVVAEEVRKLADNSNANLQTISFNMKEVLEKVDNGVHLSEEAGSALLEVGTKTSQTTSLMSEVAAAMDEQVAGANEVLKSINSLVESSAEIKNLSNEQQSKSLEMRDNLEKTVRAFTEVQQATKELEIGNNEIMTGIDSLKEVISNNDQVVKNLQEELSGYKV